MSKFVVKSLGECDVVCLSPAIANRVYEEKVQAWIDFVNENPDVKFIRKPFVTLTMISQEWVLGDE